MDTARMSTPHTTSPWKNLLPPAMVGTDKKPLALPALGGASGFLSVPTIAGGSRFFQGLVVCGVLMRAVSISKNLRG